MRFFLTIYIYYSIFFEDLYLTGHRTPAYVALRTGRQDSGLSPKKHTVAGF